MSGRFETLIYTDCRPGQGLAGSAGLQFQARSSNEAAAATGVVQRHLLYEPPSRWIAEQRPVDAFPRSFAHVHADGLFATAAGVYLGQEANGGRPGNQLTHSLVTRDPADYQGLRPAQLFGAPFWTDRPAPTTTSPAIEVEAKATAYSPARARAFVLDQPDGQETLLALASALETAGQPGGRRVLFVGDDVPSIVEWLAAGTFLLPRARALELGFKILSTDPAHAGVPVVAVHRDFAGTAGRIDNQLGYTVFNVDCRGHTPVEATDAAARWVGLFFTEDPQDVVDALDIAAVSGLESEQTAAALGLAAVLRREPAQEHAEAIVGWLRTGPAHLREAYAADIAELFAERPDRWPRRVLRPLDAVGCDGLIPGQAASVRLALIHSEVAAARAAAEVQDARLPVLPPGEWGPEEATIARRMLVAAIDWGVPAAHVDALLRVATRFDVDLRYPEIEWTARKFVADWAAHPAAGYDPARWPHGSDYEQLLIAHLAEQAAAGEARAAAVGDGWWAWLLRQPGLPEALLAAALGAAVRHSRPRQSLVDKQLAAARESPGGFAWMAGALWSQTAPTLPELRLLRERAPAGVRLPPHIFNAFVARLCGSAELDLAEMQVCVDLVQDGLLLPGPALTAVLADNRAVVEAVDLLMRGASDDDRSRAVRQLCGRPRRLVAMRVPAVVDALVRAAEPAHLLPALRAHPDLAAPYVRRVVERPPGRDDARLAAALFAGYQLMDRPARLRGAAIEVVQQWLVRATDRRIDAARDWLAPLGRQWQQMWDIRTDETGGQRRRYRMAHPLRGR